MIIVLAMLTQIANPVMAGYGSPIIDGIRDACYDLIVWDTDSELGGDFPIKIYVAYDILNVYYFISMYEDWADWQILWVCFVFTDGDGFDEVQIYLYKDQMTAEVSVDAGPSEVIPESATYQVGAVSGVQFEGRIPRSFSVNGYDLDIDVYPWQYIIVGSLTDGSDGRWNTGWGTTDILDLDDPTEWLSSPFAPLTFWERLMSQLSSLFAWLSELLVNLFSWL